MVWHAAPFAFVIFYGLQTLPQDQIEAAKIDDFDISKQDIIIPHLFPLITFVALIQLMDNFRVFEPIVVLMLLPMLKAWLVYFQ